MNKAIETFEGLIRRSIAPSVTFFVTVVSVDLVLLEYTGGSAVHRGQRALEFVAKTFEESGTVFTVLVGLLILGVSYALTAMQQILFDNRLKGNFDPSWQWWAQEGKALRELRGRVLGRLESESVLADHPSLNEGTDYVLYEILGGIDTIDTRKFVDSAKALGITCVSMMLGFLYGVVAYGGWLSSWEVVVLTVLGILAFWFGRESILAQYRARALRLYVNFLMMPAGRLHRRLLWPEGEPGSSKGKAAGKS